MIRCIFFLILIINVVFCESPKDLKKKLQKENKILYDLIQQIESDLHSSRKSRGFGLNINQFLKKFKKDNTVDKEISKNIEELRHVISDEKLVDNDYEDDNDNEFRQANGELEDDYYEEDEDESFLNNDNPRSDDPRHFLKKKFLMLQNLWRKKERNNTSEVNSGTIPTNNNDVPTYVAYITLPASELADASASEPVEDDANINTGTPTGTGTGTGTITAQPADFVPDDLPDESILPNVELNNNSSINPDKPDNIVKEPVDDSVNSQNLDNLYGSRAQTEKNNKKKVNSVKLFEIIEEDGDNDIVNDNMENEAEVNDEINKNSSEDQQQIAENREKHKVFLQQQDYIQQQIQKQLYEMQMQQDKQQRRRKKKRKKKIRPENQNVDENAGILYYTKYLPPNLRKLMQIRPTVYLRGKAKNDGRKTSRILH